MILYKKEDLNVEQQSILLRYLYKSVSTSENGILLSLSTGLCIGELCALKWSDIDLEKSIINASHSMQRIKNTDGKTSTKIIITSLKSKSSARKIPIPDFMLPILKKSNPHLEVIFLRAKSFMPNRGQ